MLAALTSGLVLAEQDHGCRVTHDPCPQALCVKTGDRRQSRPALPPTPSPGFQRTSRSHSLHACYCSQFSSVAQSCLTLCNPMDCIMPELPVHHQLMSIESVMPSIYLILCCPLLFPPSVFPSISVFSNESVLCIRWPKGWSFSFSISPSNEYSGLISFRMYWLDLLAVQGTLSRVFSNTTVQKHQFFGSQLYGPTLTSVHHYWKNHIFNQTDLCWQSNVSTFLLSHCPGAVCPHPTRGGMVVLVPGPPQAHLSAALDRVDGCPASHITLLSS